MNIPLIVISVLFGLSLLAAWVLFAVLKSTATVQKPQYQLGGAAAGFVVILTLLCTTYMQIDDKKKKIDQLTNDLKQAQEGADEAKSCRAEQATSEVIYSGTVQPPMQAANVILGVSGVQLQQDGKFAIKVHNVKPSDFPYLYVIGADSHAPYKQVFAQDDTTKLVIPH